MSIDNNEIHTENMISMINLAWTLDEQTTGIEIEGYEDQFFQVIVSKASFGDKDMAIELTFIRLVADPLPDDEDGISRPFGDIIILPTNEVRLFGNLFNNAINRLVEYSFPGKKFNVTQSQVFDISKFLA